MEDTNDKKNITEQIQLLVELMKVKSSVRDNITQDYTIAFLNKDEREYISENYQNAEYAGELIKKFANKGYYYFFDDDKGDWKRDGDGYYLKVPLNENEIKFIYGMSKRIFDFFMVHPHMIAILNRNKTDNFLVKLLGKQQEDEKPIAYGQDDRGILEKIKDKVMGGGEEVYEEND